MKDKTRTISSNGRSTAIKWSDEEPDTRLIFQALQAKSDVVVVSKETEVISLFTWTCSLFDIYTNRYIKCARNSYVDINLIAKLLGSNISKIRPTIHANIGWGTTSNFFKVREIKVFRNNKKYNSLFEVMSNLILKTELDTKDLNNVTGYIRCTLYNGEERETYIEKRIRLHESKRNHLCQFH